MYQKYHSPLVALSKEDVVSLFIRELQSRVITLCQSRALRLHLLVDRDSITVVMTITITTTVTSVDVWDGIWNGEFG